MQQMELVGIRVELQGNVPVAILREAAGERALPIYIGTSEARAIAEALEGHVPPRPMTHDLLVSLVTELAHTVVRAEITKLEEHTFFAELVVEGPAGEHRIGCRPSDAMAVTARTGAPIFADESVLDEAGVVGLIVDEESDDPDEVADPAQERELVDEFRRFIEQISPEDFAP